MKFDITSGEFKGIINYFKSYSIPSPSIDATKETYNDIKDIIYHEKAPFIEYAKQGTSPINLIFDFSFLRVKISHYLLETSISGSPPTEWQLVRSYNIKGPWNIVDSTRANDTLCPKTSADNQCNKRTISTWKCSSPGKSYRYIKFVMIKDRSGASNYRYLRIGGIEFYGTAYSFESLNSPHSLSTCRSLRFSFMINYLISS